MTVPSASPKLNKCLKYYSSWDISLTMSRSHVALNENKCVIGG